MKTNYLLYCVVTLFISTESRSLSYHERQHESTELQLQNGLEGQAWQNKTLTTTKISFNSSSTINTNAPKAGILKNSERETCTGTLEDANTEKEIIFKIGARGLSINVYNSTGKLPSAFAILSGDSSGRTETIQDDENPDWPDTFSFIYNPECIQAIDVEIRHQESDNEETIIGFANINATKMMDSCDMTFADIGDDGMYIRVERLTECETSEGGGLAWWKILLYVVAGIAVLIIAIFVFIWLGPDNTTQIILELIGCEGE